MVATDKPTYRVIGTRPIRPDGTDKVTGRAEYGADLRLEGMLYGAVLRSPHAHARIKRIDTSKAEALPGVRAVVTSADFPRIESGEMNLGEGSGNPKWIADNVIASDKALYHGHAVAAVAATDAHIAEAAALLIEVEYEVLPAVIDVREAMLETAPILHPDMRTNVQARGVPASPNRPTNIIQHIRLEKGDLDAGFAQAEVTIEREYETGMVHQGYIEPQNGTAYWNLDGSITIWTSTQGSFAVRDQTSAILQVPASTIKVIPMEIGGGFGGKVAVYLEPVAAVLSRKSGRPVKLTMSREAVFQGTGPTSGTYIRVKLGAKKDGTLTAAYAYMAYQTGAYPGWGCNAGTQMGFAPYDIPNQVVDGFDVVVNAPKTAAYRAPGAPAAAFAIESTLHELANMLGMDQVDLRLKNVSRAGSPDSVGVPWPRIGAEEVMQAVKHHPHYTSELHGDDTGRGVAFSMWHGIGLESSSTAVVNADGIVNLILGSTDIGGSRAALAMQLAESLGVTMEQVRPQVTDTDSVGYSMPTVGSRTTFAGGWVAYELGQEIRRQMVVRAAEIWNVPADQVTYGDDGVITAKQDGQGNPNPRMTFAQLAGRLGATGGRISVSATVNKNTAGPSVAGHIVDLKVDRETGKVTILRYTAVQDVGTAIHPAYVEGQIQGGVAQGIGMALNEEYVYDNEGHLRNGSFLDYRMPVANDLPMIETVMVEVPNPGHPYGVRGVGEVPIMPPQAAVRNAIENAIGMHFYRTPVSPRVILEELLPND